MNSTKKQKIAVDGVEIAYYDSNPSATSAHTIVFLHGWGGSADSFIELASLFGPESRKIIIDFPGFGDSQDPPTPWDVHMYVECVVKYLAALNIRHASFVVHSFGGRIVTVLASTYPQIVQNIIYIAPAGIRHNRTIIAGIALVLKSVMQLPLLRYLFPMVRKIGYRLIHDTDYEQSSGVMKETFQLVTQEDLQYLFPEIHCPVTIFWGANDSYVPVSDTEVMKRYMPQAAVHVFADGRHGIHKTHAKEIITHLNQEESL